MIQDASKFSYSGNELELFENATNWKKYLFNEIEKHVGTAKFSLEVGCGIGANSSHIVKFSNVYLGIEPDAALIEKAKLKYPDIDFLNGFFIADNIESDVKPDLILLIDVLEHIENDYQEINKIWDFLETGSSLVILVPAHQFLFSQFDASVGHYRRYSKKSLIKLFSEYDVRLNVVKLDSLGFFLSLASKILNPSGQMTLKKVRFWNALIPISKKIDRLFNFKIGKSLLVVAHKQMATK